MKLSLPSATCWLALLAGCATSSDIINADSTPYQAMNCIELNDQFNTERLATLALLSNASQQSERALTKDEKDQPVWQAMLNNSVNTVQDLFDSASNSISSASKKKLAIQRGKLISIEDAAVTKFCSGLLEQLTVHRVEIRQQLNTSK